MTDFKFAPNVILEERGFKPRKEELDSMVQTTFDNDEMPNLSPMPPFKVVSPPPPPRSPPPQAAEEEVEEKKEEQQEQPKKKRVLKVEKAVHPVWFWFVFFILTVGFSIVGYYAPLVFFSKTTTAALVAQKPPTFIINTAAHVTKSVDLDLRSSYAKPLLASLEASFYAHLSSSSAYACLCMHHMKPSIAGAAAVPAQFKICAVHNRYMDKVHLMVNPSLVGHGNKTDFYEEVYASDPSKQPKKNVQRYRHVFIRWSDIETGDELTLQLGFMQAVCMQVALDEMNN
ncbi:MAG: peptide deformylase [Nitrosomonas sp.]|nr:peptide deformylase [Nitrosomonas sp.]